MAVMASGDPAALSDSQGGSRPAFEIPLFKVAKLQHGSNSHSTNLSAFDFDYLSLTTVKNYVHHQPHKCRPSRSTPLSLSSATLAHDRRDPPVYLSSPFAFTLLVVAMQ